MKKKVLVVVAVVLSVLSVQAQTGEKMGGSVEKQISALEHKWAQAQKASDTDAIAPMLANNMVMLFANGTVMNKSQTLDDAKKSKFEMVEVSDIKVTSYGNTAIAVGVWKGKGTDASGKPVDENERFVDTWHKMSDGKWQCLASGNTNIQ